MILINKPLRLLLFLLLGIWCIGFSLNVISPGSTEAVVFSPVINLFYDNICHQDQNKTIELNGFSFFICARCTGIYTGALLVAFISIFFFKEIKIPFRLITLTMIVLSADVVINNFINSGYNKTTAFLTGFLGGTVLLPVIISLFEKSLTLKSSEG
jgi:uncharacterized membrane protein